MAEYACDNADGNMAVMTLTSHIDPSAPPQFLCGMCFAIYGIALAREMFPELLADPDAEPAPKPKRSRGKAAGTVAEYDANRTVAAVTESEPRDEPVAGAPVTPEATAAAEIVDLALANGAMADEENAVY